jgi:hypothetical protein
MSTLLYFSVVEFSSEYAKRMRWLFGSAVFSYPSKGFHPCASNIYKMHVTSSRPDKDVHHQPRLIAGAERGRCKKPA